MPAKHKAAQSSSAQAMLASRGAPDSLESFLGGFVAGGDTQDVMAHDQEGVITMNLRLLNKSSDITKQKALNELITLISTAREDIVAGFVSNIAEGVIRNAHDHHPPIRAAAFTLLAALVGRGRDVKVLLTTSLPSLCGVWVMAMNDMDRNVRQEAQAAFDSAFSVEKRPAVLAKYQDDIMACLFDGATEVVDGAAVGGSGPLQDDVLDKRSNRLYAALRGLGYMVKLVSSSHNSVLTFILEKPTFAKVLPRRTNEKGYIAAKTPLVRSSALALLRDVTTVCPITPKMHQMIAQAIHSSMRDSDVSVVSRVWELLLLWCRAGAAEAINYLPAGFFDDVIDSFMECAKPELAEVLFPCIFPLLTQFSKDSRCGGILDEFCGALVEKVRLLTETPNVSAAELKVILASLMECWELHGVRKKGTSAAGDCEELFTVIVFNLCLLTQHEVKRRRFSRVVADSLATSLLKTSVRLEGVFKSCMAILNEDSSCAFKVLPDDPELALVTSFHELRASALGTLYATASASSTYARQLPMYERLLESALQRQLAAGPSGARELAIMLLSTNSTFKPMEETCAGVVQAMLDGVRAEEEARKQAKAEGEDAAPSSCTSTDTVFRQLVPVVLRWFSSEESQKLLDTFKDADAVAVQEAVKQHLLSDPAQAAAMLVSACEAGHFDDIARCLQQLNEFGSEFSKEDITRVLAAIETSLRATLTVAEGGGANNDNGNSATERDAAKSKGTSGAGAASDDGEEVEEEDEEEADMESNDDAENGDGDSLNRADEIMCTVLEWAQLLERDSLLSQFLQLDAQGFSERFAELVYLFPAALAPRVYAEQYISIKAMRVVLQAAAAAAQKAEDIDEEDEGDEVMLAMEAKKHSLRMDDYAQLTEVMAHLLDSYGITAAARDAFAADFAERMMDWNVKRCYQATHQLQQAIPFASKRSLRALIASPDTWAAVAMPHTVSEDATLQRSALSLFTGYYTLQQLGVSFTDAVRTAQLIRLADYCGIAATDDGDCDRPMVFFFLLQAASVREALSHASVKLLFERLLPEAFKCFSTRAAAGRLAQLLTEKKLAADDDDGDDEIEGYMHLVCTLGAVVRDIARRCIATDESRVQFLLAARRVVSAVTSHAVTALFTETGARNIDVDVAMVYNTFFSNMDEAANVVRDNMLAQLPPEQERLMAEAVCMLPTWDLTTAKLALVVHRHLSTMPVIHPNTVTSLLEFAKKQTPIDGLELLAELSLTRIIDLTVYSELVRVIVATISRAYCLCHLPTNGRLQQQPAGRPPYSFSQLMRVAVATVLARRGVIIHSRMDDVLRSTVNLVVFDIVCESVSQLRQTRGADVPLLVKLISFVSGFMGDLMANDVAVVRASEVSAQRIAQVTTFAYLWVRATPISKLEAIGMETVAGVMRSVCLLANLTLINSKFSLCESVNGIISKLSLNAVREDFSSANPAKLSLFRRQNTLVTKTHKQKLLLFPYLLGWGVVLTTPPPQEENPALASSAQGKERRKSIYALLDLLFSLLLTPTFKGAKRVEETYIGATLMNKHGGRDAGDAVGGSGLAVGTLGFEMVALTRVDSDAMMEQLARGAAAVFSLLLQGPTLFTMKSWLDTIERKSQAMFCDFVEQYLSPLLIEERLLAVLSHSHDGSTTFSISDSFSVRVGVQQRAIDLMYEMEDAKVAVRIMFPSAFPLRQPIVEASSGSGKACGVSSEKWRAWMLRMTVMLFDGSSNIWECIELFQRNLDAHFSGQEPCPICFAVVNAVNHKLPDLRCSVCHNSAIHSNCLHTWWANGGQTTCPLCRSPWVSE